MKLRLHPLFTAVGIVSAIFGGLPEFLIYALTALLHECGHIFCASGMGYGCKSISLMPYGASALIDIEGISASDEIKLAFAGPLVNALICVTVAGLWWFYPTAYGYTDTVMQASVSMLAVNLLPAYPLDGGRVVGRVFERLFSKRVADICMRIAALGVAVGFAMLFFISNYNISAICMAVFMLSSAFEKRQLAVRADFSRKKRLKRGWEVKYVMCDAAITYRKAIKHLEDSRYLVLQIYADNGELEEVTQDELYLKLQTADIYDKIINSVD